MRMYKIQRTTKRKCGNAVAHRYRTSFGRFLQPAELKTDFGEEISLYHKKAASYINKQLRKIDRKHNFKMVLADNI